jgi:multidrug transporter EmrE-like cation transporter
VYRSVLTCTWDVPKCADMCWSVLECAGVCQHVIHSMIKWGGECGGVWWSVMMCGGVWWSVMMCARV